MTMFVFIPGAGGEAAYWHRVTPLLRAAGHDVVAVDLPADDEKAGWREYADATVAAVNADRTRQDVVVVGQSMGGFTAPLVADRLAARHIVLVNAMIPTPGETGGAWWTNTDQEAARQEMAKREGRDPDAPFDPFTDFFHDVPEDAIKELAYPPRAQSDTPFGQPWPLDSWPAVPSRVLAGQDDRLFPPDFQERIARERLGVAAERLPGGHLIALSRPRELADALLA